MVDYSKTTNNKTDLNDARLSKRFAKITKQLSKNLSGSIPQAAQNKGATKAMYRFFHNKKVSEAKLLVGQFQRLCDNQSLAKANRLLSLSDSVELDYTTKRSADNLGPLTYQKRRGMILHNSIVLDESGVPYGLLDQSYIIRSDATFGTSAKNRYLPIEKKESIKWLNHFKKAQQLCARLNKEVVFVGDREADMMDIFHAKEHELMHYVIRSQFNRSLNNSNLKLHDVLAKQRKSGSYEIELVNPITMKKRKAILVIRFCAVEVKLQSSLKSDKHLTPITLNAIEVKEINAPNDIGKPICWRLLTSLPIKDFSDAQQIILYYVLRWIIERFHFALKSGGAKVEQLQIEKAQHLKNAITTYSIITMDVLNIKYLAEKEPDKKIYEAGITIKQHEVLYTYAHSKGLCSRPFDKKNPPTIYEFCRVLGKIGGFIPSKRQPLPGIKILTRALEKFYVLMDFYDVYMSKN